jgi:aminoglycoside phosphotransferase (APT) family kinase protein
VSTARVDELLLEIAGALSLTVVRIPEGGEFGAVFVENTDGEVLVLKASPGIENVARWAHGAALATALREEGYPAPVYRGNGQHGDAAWSLQEVLPGEIPPRATPDHVAQLLALAERHAGKAVGTNADDHREPMVQRSIEGAQWLQQHSAAAALGRELEEVLGKLSATPLPMSDICHGDFHHRNFLAYAGTVTGVFDWELATCGDWRMDVATLAFWSSVGNGHDPVAAALAVDRLAEVCKPAVRALFGATLTTRVIGFYAAVHPDWVAPTATAVDTTVAQWWRG